ncbi:RnfH family protein [Billgrantia diversa]|nr:RnfH family protein [Halomonas sp. MCCC 1A13316]
MGADMGLAVEVVFALPDRQRIVALEVPEGTTARQAVALAGLDRLFPEVPAATFAEADLGIFGKLLRDPDVQRLRAGDRVEVYRPLEIDPKAARARRAERAGR